MMAQTRPASDIANVDSASPLGKRKFLWIGDKRTSNLHSVSTNTYFENLTKKVKIAATSSVLSLKPQALASRWLPYARSFDSRVSLSLRQVQSNEKRHGTQPMQRGGSLKPSQQVYQPYALKTRPVFKSYGLPVHRNHQTPSRQAQHLHAEKTPSISCAVTASVQRSVGTPTITLATLSREVHGPVQPVGRCRGEENGFPVDKLRSCEVTEELAASDWKITTRLGDQGVEEGKEGFKRLHANRLDTTGQGGLEIDSAAVEARLRALENENKEIRRMAEENARAMKEENRGNKARMKELEELREYKRRVEALQCRAAEDPVCPVKDQTKQCTVRSDAGITKVMSYRESLLAQPIMAECTTDTRKVEMASNSEQAPSPVEMGLGSRQVPSQVELGLGSRQTPSPVQKLVRSQEKPSFFGARIDDEFRRHSASREMEIDAIRSQMASFSLKREERTRAIIQFSPEPEEASQEKEEVVTCLASAHLTHQDSALVPLSLEANEAVDAALGGGASFDILAVHRKENIDVTREKMHCLRESTWLNDEVINVYLALLQEREAANRNKHLRCHFFNTFFFNKLYRDKGEYEYKSVRRWTTPKKLSYKLHECDKILVPIHLDIHWCLAVINIYEKKFEYLDSLGAIASSKIARSIFDSLARYITDEAKDKAGVVLDVSDWERVCPEDIPRQENGCDCGVFMVKYADYHSRNVPLNFAQCHMPYFRRRMVWEILQGKAL